MWVAVEFPTLISAETVPIELLLNKAIPPFVDDITPPECINLPFSEYNPAFPPAAVEMLPLLVSVPPFWTTPWCKLLDIVAPVAFVTVEFSVYTPIDVAPVTFIFFVFSNIALFSNITPYPFVPATVIVPLFLFVPVVPVKYIPIFLFPFTLIFPSFSNAAVAEYTPILSPASLLSCILPLFSMFVANKLPILIPILPFAPLLIFISPLSAFSNLVAYAGPVPFIGPLEPTSEYKPKELLPVIFIFPLLTAKGISSSKVIPPDWIFFTLISPLFSNLDPEFKSISVFATTIPWFFCPSRFITPSVSLIAVIFQLFRLRFSREKLLVANPADSFPCMIISFLFIKVWLLFNAFSEVNNNATCLFISPWISPLFIPVTCIKPGCTSGWTSIPAVFSALK